jgi:hypothetical protein
MSFVDLFIPKIEKPIYTLQDDAYYYKLLTENLNYLASMSVRNVLLYKKYIEIRTIDTSNTPTNVLIAKIKNRLWKYDNPEDYLNIEPKLLICDSPQLFEEWRLLKLFTSIASIKTNPGRAVKLFVIDKPTNKYLGIISLGSDFTDIGGRDAVIGWCRGHQKYQKLKHTMMVSTIVPTQPLGTNYLGGKLIALLCSSDIVENYCNSVYKEPLLGITTTSLFGGFSQYNNLNYWKKCKSTNGKVIIEPSDDVYKELLFWLGEKHPDIKRKCAERTPTNNPASHPKNNILNAFYRILKVKPVVSGYSRGVYWCALKERTNEFLADKTDNYGDKKFDNSIETLTKLWKEKYATKRVKKLIEQNKLNPEPFWMGDMLELSEEEMFTKYSRDED